MPDLPSRVVTIDKNGANSQSRLRQVEGVLAGTAGLSTPHDPQPARVPLMPSIRVPEYGRPAEIMRSSFLQNVRASQKLSGHVDLDIVDW